MPRVMRHAAVESAWPLAKQPQPADDSWSTQISVSGGNLDAGDRQFGYSPINSSYLTMMMATGLTFGTIASLYGFTHHYIDQAQYTALVTVVITTAIVPTIIAQAVFPPTQEVFEAESGGLEEIEIASAAGAVRT